MHPVSRSFVHAAGALALLASLTSRAWAGESAPPHPMSLEDALEELERQSPTLSEARARAEEAQAVAQQVRAALLPTLSASGSYTRNSDEAKLALAGLIQVPAGASPPAAVIIQPLEAWSAGASLRVPLVVPSAWFDLTAARAGAEVARATMASVRLGVRTGFAQAAYARAAYDEIVVASERAVELAAEHAQSTERRVRAGTAAPLDVLRAKTEMVRRESDRARARADLGRAELGLGILLGRAEPVRVAVPVLSLEEGAPGPSPNEVRQAAAHRPDRIAAQAETNRAQAEARSAWARLFPQLSASGNVFAADVAYPTGKKEGWRVSLDLVWTLYDGGLRYGRARQAEASGRAAGAADRAVHLRALQEIEDARRDIDVARERLRLASEEQSFAADAAASAQRSFDAGVASNTEVLDANDRLYQSDIGLADARARFAQALWSLERALGRDR